MALHVLGPANTLDRLFNTLSRLLFYHTGLALLQYARFVHASGPLLFHLQRDILTHSLTQEGLDSNLLGHLCSSVNTLSFHTSTSYLLPLLFALLLLFFFCCIMHFTYLCCFLCVLLQHISSITQGFLFPVIQYYLPSI